ncbi:hypothetical protein QAD02_001392 [Eretmocerus hayati]|uniref:Uncharacterized protein n=1 Tax=Eretmocerus hayati TaxID=131215 RepID=A0ACC2NG39_9HYME|nr:hypothetical protein QAD02_001392 [Eretmocerus hayati]
MKVLSSKYPSMDNKSKFSDRFKALLNTDTHKGIDPYVFSDNDQPTVASTGGKNIQLIAPKNSKTPSINRPKSKGKCLKTAARIKSETNPYTAIKEEIKPEVFNLNNQLQKPYQYAPKLKHRYLKKLQRIKGKSKNRDHTLQYYPRAGDEVSDSESSGDEVEVFQRHWYTGEPDSTSARSSRLAQLHSQLQRQLQQLQFVDGDMHSSLKKKTLYLVEAAARDPTATARILNGGTVSNKIIDGPLIVGGPCGVKGCQQISLPCTRHCSQHIMLNTDQLLFEHCTAKFSDNTQCCIPVFDVAHELPLCPEHARKRDNYHRRAQESKPKKARSKKPVSPTIVASAKSKSRPKKRKRPPSISKMDIPAIPVVPNIISPINVALPPAVTTALVPEENHFSTPIILPEEIDSKTLNHLNEAQQNCNSIPNLNALGLDIASIGLGPGIKVELDDHEILASLDHATEFENVLNNLPADAFNDLFIEGRNGDYEPTIEDEEELERAVEAFDKVERLGQTHGLLEPALLAQLMGDIVS